MKNSKIKCAILIIIILLLSVGLYMFSLNRITLATGGATGTPAQDATEASKKNPVDANDWANKQNESPDQIHKKAGKNPPWNPATDEIPPLTELVPAEQVRDDGVYISLEDYRNIPSIFCCMHGTPLPGYNSTIVKGMKGETVLRTTDVTDQGTPTRFLTVEELNSATCFYDTEWSGWGGPDHEKTYDPYDSKTYGKFTKQETRLATPAEAWVLAELDNNVPGGGGHPNIDYATQPTDLTPEQIAKLEPVEIDGQTLYATGEGEEGVGTSEYYKKEGDKYYKASVSYPGGGSGTTSYVQYAWWKVKTVGKPSNEGNSNADAGLAAEAEDFETYVREITGVAKPGVVPRNDAGYFDIDYKVGFEDNHTVKFNAETNKYIIGPYKLSYMRATSKQEPRNKVSFAGISGAILVGMDANDKEVLNEDGSSKLQLGKNYRFIYENDALHTEYQTKYFDTEEEYPFPYDGEEFYIEIDYLDEVVKIKSLKFDFQYMTANGTYDYYTGEYLDIHWDCMSDIEAKATDTSSGSGSIVNSTTKLAVNLNNEVSSRGAGTKLGTIKGDYSKTGSYIKDVGQSIDHSGISVTSGTNHGDFPDWCFTSGKHLQASITSCKKTAENAITVKGKVVEKDCWNIFGWTKTKVTVKDSGGNSKSYKEDGTFEFTIATGDKMYNKEIYYITASNYIEWSFGYTAKLSANFNVSWYNSVLNHSGNEGSCDVYSANDKVQLDADNNTLYYKGLLSEGKVAVDFDAYAPGKNYEGTTNPGYIQYNMGPDILAVRSQWQGTYTFFDHGSKGGDESYVITKCKENGTGSYVEIERMKLPITVANMGISKGDDYDNTSETCTVTGSTITEENQDDEHSQSPVETFNLFTAFDNECVIEYDNPDVTGKYVHAQFSEDYTQVTVNRTDVCGEDGSGDIFIKDSKGNQVVIHVSWTGSQSGTNPPQPPSPGYQYRFKDYLVARTMHAKEAQAQADANGSHKVVDVDAEYGIGDSIGQPAELEIVPEPIDLRTSLEGMVWIDMYDEQKKQEQGSGGQLGVYDDGIDKYAPVKSVQVVVYKITCDENGNVKEREPAKAWEKDGKTPIDFSKDKLYIGENGRYEVPMIQVPSKEGNDGTKNIIAYDVEFIYDGQSYEVTEFLVPDGGNPGGTVEEKLKAFESTVTDGPEKDYEKYAKSSYVIENPDERKEFDRSFTEIKGKDPITEDRQTTGEAIGTDGKTKELKYEGEAVGEGNNEKTKSRLVTLDGEYVGSSYQLKARTSETGLLLPYERQYHVVEDYYDNLTVKTQVYRPVDEYLEQINMGLLERYDADIAVKKDLYTANVVVNGQANLTKYNTLMPIRSMTEEQQQEALNIQIDNAYRSHTYSIQLYNSDYKYRSGAYTSIQDEVTKKIVKAVKEGTELRVFLTYKLEFLNESILTDVSINEFKDYYDKTFTPVTKEIKMPIEDQSADINEPQRIEKVVAEAPYYRKLIHVGTTNTYYYNKAEDMNESLDKDNKLIETVALMDRSNPDASDLKDAKLHKGDVKITDGQATRNNNFIMTSSVSLKGRDDSDKPIEELTLEPGEVLEVFITYEVDKEGYQRAVDASNAATNGNVNDTDRTDLATAAGLDKFNIVEVSNYTTFYTEESVKRTSTTRYQAGDVSGRVDKDSAPDNINIEKAKDEGRTKFLEDDTEFAPKVTISVKETENRILNGTVWEDMTDDQGKVDGIYDADKESGIEKIDVTLVEKIRVTKEDIDRLERTGSDATKEFLKDINNHEMVNHEFEYIWPKGSFGNPDYTSLALTSDKGNYEFKDILSGIYVVRFEYGDDVNDTDLKYNGQDYKNTTYQKDVTNKFITVEGGNANVQPKTELGAESTMPIDTSDERYLYGKPTLNNEWHDLSDSQLAKDIEAKRYSDARDYEPQRLRTIAYSRIISNHNAEVLSSNIKTDVTTREDKDNNYKVVDHTTPDYQDILATDENKKELVENTKMVANTAKLFIDIERQNTITYKKVKVPEGESVVKYTDGTVIDARANAGADKYEYRIENIDFGLLERPETRINIEKEIAKIELLKEDGKTPILSVSCDEYGDLIKDDSAVNIEKISEIVKKELNGQGFKYIAMEAKLLNGLQVRLTYNIQVVNHSEVDYMSANFANYKNIQQIYDLADILENHDTERLYVQSTEDEAKNPTANKVPYNTGKAIIYGRYLGTYYYTNEVCDDNSEDKINTKYSAHRSSADGGKPYYTKYNNEEVVKTTVDQLVDYVDNDLSIDKEATRNIENKTWLEASNNDVTNKLSAISYVKAEDGKYNKDIKLLKDDKNRTYITKDSDGADVANNINISKNDTITKEPTAIKYNKARLVVVDEDGKELYRPEMKLTTKEILEPALEEDHTYNAYTTVDSTMVTGAKLYSLHNPDLTKELSPYSVDKTKAVGTIQIVTTSQASEEKVNNMVYDNLAEILIYSNGLGRRDMHAIPGNANMIAKTNRSYEASYVRVYYDENGQKLPDYKFKAQETTIAGETGSGIKVKTERDAFAARDTVTFSEPTGLNLERRNMQTTVRVVLVGLIIAAIGLISGIIVIALRKKKYDDGDILNPRN